MRWFIGLLIVVFVICLSQFFVATICSCKIVCFSYSSSHFQLEVFVGNTQSAKACKLSTVKVANQCQNTDMINLYSQVLDVCYLIFFFCFIPILQISFSNDGTWVVVSFWVQIKCFEENNAQILFNLSIDNSCDALSVFLLWHFYFVFLNFLCDHLFI